MVVAAYIIIGVCVSVVTHVATMAAAGWLVGGRIEEVSLFSGRKLVKTTFGGTRIRIGFIPFGGYAKLDDSFQSLHPIKRVFVPACGCLSLILLAAAVFGVSEAYHKFASGFAQFVSGAVAPRFQGSRLLSNAYDFVRSSPLAVCVGLVASKMAAFNLLPVPVFNGGDILLTLPGWVKPLSQKARERIQMVGFLILVVAFISWFVAFCYSLVRW